VSAELSARRQEVAAVRQRRRRHRRHSGGRRANHQLRSPRLEHQVPMIRTVYKSVSQFFVQAKLINTIIFNAVVQFRLLIREML